MIDKLSNELVSTDNNQLVTHTKKLYRISRIWSNKIYRIEEIDENYSTIENNKDYQYLLGNDAMMLRSLFNHLPGYLMNYINKGCTSLSEVDDSNIYYSYSQIYEMMSMANEFYSNNRELFTNKGVISRLDLIEGLLEDFTTLYEEYMSSR